MHSSCTNVLNMPCDLRFLSLVGSLPIGNRQFCDMRPFPSIKKGNGLRTNDADGFLDSIKLGLWGRRWVYARLILAANLASAGRVDDVHTAGT